MRLAIIATHPVQYYAPFFRLLGKEPAIELKVFYTWSQSEKGKTFDRDFGKEIEWDIPLLDGYNYEFVSNAAKNPGVHHFRGIVNPDLNKKVLEWNPDFVMVIGWNFTSHLSAMRFFKGKIPVIFRGDSTLLDEKPGVKQLVRRMFLSWVYSHVNYAFYVGANNKAYFRKHGLKESQLFWVPHTIDNERFAGRDAEFESETGRWKEEIGITDENLVLLFAGKLEPKKDPGFMLRLAKAIPDPRLKIVIVGNGILENGLKAESLADKRIIFLDFQNQQKMPLVYRLGDIFVLPSTGPGETWGLAVNEAMASSRPVIVSAMAGCAADLVEENKNGWSFVPGEQGDRKILERLEKLLNSRISLKEMGAASRGKIRPLSYRAAVDQIKLFLKNNDPSKLNQKKHN